jgi:hypothetical protein
MPLRGGERRGERGWRHRQSIAYTEHQHGLVPCNVELEAPGRGEVLDVIKTPIALRAIEEPAIPVRSSAIGAVAKCADWRQPSIRAPSHVPALYDTVKRITPFSLCSA